MHNYNASIITTHIMSHQLEDDSDSEMESVPSFASFAEILAYYRKFLSGEIRSCPTHCGPLEEESSQILWELLMINKLGILTIDSQPGSTMKLDAEEPDDSTCTTISQRAYLDCYMSYELAMKLVRLLRGSRFLIFAQKYTEPSNDEPITTIPVTITLQGQYCIGTETAMPIQWLSPDFDSILAETPPEKWSEITQDLYSVRILDPIWGRKSALFNEVILTLTASPDSNM